MSYKGRSATYMSFTVPDKELARSAQVGEKDLALRPRDRAPVPGLVAKLRSVRRSHHVVSPHLLGMRRKSSCNGCRHNWLRNGCRNRWSVVWDWSGVFDGTDIVPWHQTHVSAGVATSPPLRIVRRFVQHFQDFIHVEGQFFNLEQK